MVIVKFYFLVRVVNIKSDSCRPLWKLESNKKGYHSIYQDYQWLLSWYWVTRPSCDPSPFLFRPHVHHWLSRSTAWAAWKKLAPSPAPTPAVEAPEFWVKLTLFNRLVLRSQSGHYFGSFARFSEREHFYLNLGLWLSCSLFKNLANKMFGKI